MSISRIFAVFILLQVHLFDIDIPGGICFKESETLTAGKKLTVFNTDICKIGIGICYDMRFGEMAQIYRKEGKYAYVFNVNKSYPPSPSLIGVT